MAGGGPERDSGRRHLVGGGACHSVPLLYRRSPCCQVGHYKPEGALHSPCPSLSHFQPVPTPFLGFILTPQRNLPNIDCYMVFCGG